MDLPSQGFIIFIPIQALMLSYSFVSILWSHQQQLPPNLVIFAPRWIMLQIRQVMYHLAS